MLQRPNAPNGLALRQEGAQLMYSSEEGEGQAEGERAAASRFPMQQNALAKNALAELAHQQQFRSPGIDAPVA